MIKCKLFCMLCWYICTKILFGWSFIHEKEINIEIACPSTDLAPSNCHVIWHSVLALICRSVPSLWLSCGVFGRVLFKYYKVRNCVNFVRLVIRQKKKEFSRFFLKASQSTDLSALNLGFVKIDFIDHSIGWLVFEESSIGKVNYWSGNFLAQKVILVFCT